MHAWLGCLSTILLFVLLFSGIAGMVYWPWWIISALTIALLLEVRRHEPTRNF